MTPLTQGEVAPGTPGAAVATHCPYCALQCAQTLTATPGAGACALALTAAAAPEGLVARALGVAADAAPPELVALVARVAQLALDFPEIARLDVGPIAEEPGGFSVLAASATLPRDLLPSRR